MGWRETLGLRAEMVTEQPAPRYRCRVVQVGLTNWEWSASYPSGVRFATGNCETAELCKQAIEVAIAGKNQELQWQSDAQEWTVD